MICKIILGCIVIWDYLSILCYNYMYIFLYIYIYTRVVYYTKQNN